MDSSRPLAGHRSRTGRRALPYLTAPLLAALVLLGSATAGAGPAHAEPENPKPSPAEHFAGLLAEEPEGAAVVVDDSLAGDYGLAELEQSLHGSFGRLDVPYYVVASSVPDYATSSDDLLAGLQDRVGKPGLYVHLRPQQSRVHAVARQVDLPLAEADRVLGRERAFTIHTPLHTMAGVYVDTLTAPDLAERAELRWNDTLPFTWWLEARFGGLRLETRSGPAQLGELTAGVAGAAVTLGLLLGAVRSGRRGRAAKTGYTGDLPGDRALGVGRVLVLGTGAVVVVASVVHLSTAALPWEQQQRGPTPPQVGPYVASTVRVTRIAEELAEDPLYVDPLAQVGVQDLNGTADRLTGAEVPVYTAVLPMSRTDESGGDPEVLAYALHHVMDEDGLFIVVDATVEDSPKVGVALFGVEAEGLSEDAYGLWEVTGHRFDRTVDQALAELLDWLGEVSAAPGQEPETPDWVQDRAEPPYEPSRWEEFFSGRFAGALFLAGPLTAAVLLALAGLALRARGRLRAVPGRALRPRADRAVRRAVRALESAPQDRPGRDRALREIDTALAVLAGEPDELDLVGVIVLAERSVRRLDPEVVTGVDAQLCEVNPLHGQAVRRGTGPGPSLCASCTALGKSERDRRTLRVAAPEGGRVPHGELNRRWVTTGYGTRGRLEAEDLLKETDVH
ncbi:hypothetical protein [Nocardiopsis ganjiahuensis]|uniref:hypothetical protein n=1 Tax=Nocardiopsis ganjiahuensis TaxID=239984 RepID=UPI000344DC41|nr:hypothetical protein [Nocardiopsis ganjiahuensis]